jgi:hypothetical protein
MHLSDNCNGVFAGTYREEGSVRGLARGVGFSAMILAAVAGEARAGMPSMVLTDIARARLQTISFFLLVFLLCSWVVQRMWNALRSDFPRLPRLSYARAISLVALWGLVFLLVLTMISGARELMTPGAWKKEGYTFTLNREESEAGDREALRIEEGRRQGMERLRAALWTYALGHDGAYPREQSAAEVPEEVWSVPDPSGMRYHYVPGRSRQGAKGPLAFEPGVFGADRFVLMTDGEIRKTSVGELQKLLGQGGR